MPSEIMLRDPTQVASANGNLSVRFENVNGTPISSVSLLGNMAQHTGDYTLTFTNTGSVTVDIVADSSKNPYNATGKAATAGASNKELLNGLDITLAGSISTGNSAKISVGNYLDATSKTFSSRLNHGIVVADNTSTEQKIAYLNVGSDDGASCTIDALPGARLYGSGHTTFIAAVRNHPSATYEDDATEDTLTVTFQNYNSGASPKTVDVMVQASGDGSPVLAIDDAKLDGSTEYYKGCGEGYQDGNDKFKGLAITLANDPGDPTSETFTIEIERGDDWVEFAPDNSGSPGTYQSGPLTITETGETTGTVTSGNHAFFWIRFNLPDTASPGDIAIVKLRARSYTI